MSNIEWLFQPKAFVGEYVAARNYRIKGEPWTIGQVYGLVIEKRTEGVEPPSLKYDVRVTGRYRTKYNVLVVGEHVQRIKPRPGREKDFPEVFDFDVEQDQ